MTISDTLKKAGNAVITTAKQKAADTIANEKARNKAQKTAWKDMGDGKRARNIESYEGFAPAVIWVIGDNVYVTDAHKASVVEITGDEAEMFRASSEGAAAIGKQSRSGFGSVSPMDVEIPDYLTGASSAALSERRWEKPHWVSPAAIIEEAAAAFPDSEQSDGFKRKLDEVRAISEKAMQTESDFELEHFGNGKELMPFQRAGLEFVEATDGNCLISDSMGLGKTIQALAYLALHPEMRPAVIVCPASLKLNWQREAEVWLETNDRLEVIRGGKVHELTLSHELRAGIVIINYDILKKWLPELKRIQPEVLILDESHYIKSPKSSRSKAAKELAATVPHKILLTGTPVLNRPSELWNQLGIIQPDEYSSNRFFNWHLRYTAAHKINIGRDKTAWDFSGASNLDELAQSLKSIMIRRTKEQVLPELPSKRRSTILIPIDNRKEYDRADREFLAWMTEQKGEAAAERASHVEQLAKREYLKQVAIKGKMKAAIDWIKTFLESGEKLIVFGTHRSTIESVMSEFSDCAVAVIGGMTADAKNRSVDAFQNDSDVRLFVGNIQAAGVGLTLTAASNVAFLELADGPEMLKQCEDRAHRIGQENAVNCWYLLAENTIDGKIVDLVEGKREVIDKITEEKGRIGFDLFELMKEDE